MEGYGVGNAGKRDRLIMRLDSPEKFYVFQGRNLEHEGNGMMVNTEIA